MPERICNEFWGYGGRARRAPEHKFPTAYEDCYAALEWVRSSPQALPSSADPSRIFLCGDSAGGNIVHHVGIRAKGMGLRGLVLIQPFFGGEERTPSEKIDNFPLINVQLLDWFWRSYLPVEADRDHPASHVFGSHLADVEIPPMLVLVGGQDLLQDWNVRFSSSQWNHQSVQWGPNSKLIFCLDS